MKPLESITVLEFSTMITASLASMMMAEQGARVIKVEPYEMGDPMRYLGAKKADISALFANCNRGKEALRIDLKTEEGQTIIRSTIADVDVVIHTFRPGVMDKLNLGSEALRAINPQLVYVAISGFGTEGPLRDVPAYDPIIQAHAGVAATQGRGDEPAFVRTLLCDKITGYTACQAVTAALFARERSGEGQHIDLCRHGYLLVASCDVSSLRHLQRSAVGKNVHCLRVFDGSVPIWLAVQCKGQDDPVLETGSDWSWNRIPQSPCALWFILDFTRRLHDFFKTLYSPSCLVWV